jgi:hypothetical protein
LGPWSVPIVLGGLGGSEDENVAAGVDGSKRREREHGRISEENIVISSRPKRSIRWRLDNQGGLARSVYGYKPGGHGGDFTYGYDCWTRGAFLPDLALPIRSWVRPEPPSTHSPVASLAWNTVQVRQRISKMRGFGVGQV